MDIESLLNEVKRSTNSTPVQAEIIEETTEDLLDQLQMDIPKDPRIERLKTYQGCLPGEDYWQLHKMIQTFDLSDEELTEELERYGFYE